MDGVARRETVALAFQGEVHLHDAVFLDESYEEDETDEGVEVELHPEDDEGEQGAEGG